MRTPPQLSVVVPTYNRAPLLRKTLASLVQQRNPPPFEVVVADDGSADDSEQVAAEFRDRLAIRYRYQEDKGYRVAKARNMGAAIASAPILVFLDSGTLAGPGLLAGHLRSHTEHRPDPGSPACGPAVIGYTYGYRPYDPTPGLAESLARLSPQQVYERYLADPLFRDSRHEDLARFGFDLSGLKMPWLFFWTMNVSVHAADYAAVGGFDERFHSWGGEDLELGYRLHRRGVPFVSAVRPWAVEVPHERDRYASIDSNKRNALRILMTHADPAVELFWTLLTRDYIMFPAEDAYRGLLDWTDQATDLDVRPDVDRGTAGLPAGARVAVFGSGASVPDHGLRGALVDFDARLLAKVPVNGRFTTHHGLGLRTPLPDGAFDRVVITSRLSGLWPQWGEAIRAEAARIGTSIHCVQGGGPAGQPDLLIRRTPASSVWPRGSAPSIHRPPGHFETLHRLQSHGIPGQSPCGYRFVAWIEHFELPERGRVAGSLAVSGDGWPGLPVVPPVQAKSQEDSNSGTAGGAKRLGIIAAVLGLGRAGFHGIKHRVEGARIVPG